MSLNIKNEEAERLARELAAQTGETVTRAVAVAVRERLERVRVAEPDRLAAHVARIRQIGHDAATRWAEPYRTADHSDLLYDDRGLPR